MCHCVNYYTYWHYIVQLNQQLINNGNAHYLNWLLKSFDLIWFIRFDYHMIHNIVIVGKISGKPYSLCAWFVDKLTHIPHTLAGMHTYVVFLNDNCFFVALQTSYWVLEEISCQGKAMVKQHIQGLPEIQCSFIT